MIIYIGDTHGSLETYKIKYYDNFLRENDYLIVLGDFGLPWTYPDTKHRKEGEWWLNWLEQKPYTTLFVDGNHENFNLLNSYPVEEWNGGKVHRLNKKVLHLMRGQIFTINKKTLFTMGGARSTDKYLRKENYSWWKEEMPSKKEYDEALDNLDKYNWKVDYVVTHCAPTRILKQIAPYMEKDELNSFLDIVASQLDFKCWYFGHYHKDASFRDENKKLYLCSYNRFCF